MQHLYPEHRKENPPQSWLLSRTGIATVIAISVLGFLIYQGHGAHLLGFLPYLLILICPLMHFFMHGGHGGHEHREEDDSTALVEDRKKHETERKQHNHGGH